MQVHATPNYSATIFHTELQVIICRKSRILQLDDEARRTTRSKQIPASFALIAISKLMGSIKIEITLNSIHSEVQHKNDKIANISRRGDAVSTRYPHDNR